MNLIQRKLQLILAIIQIHLTEVAIFCHLTFKWMMASEVISNLWSVKRLPTSLNGSRLKVLLKVMSTDSDTGHRIAKDGLSSVMNFMSLPRKSLNNPNRFH